MDNNANQISSIEAEQSVIGGLLLDNNTIDKCYGLTSSMFSPCHTHIWQAMTDLIGNNQPADVITVNELLTQRNQDAEAGGLPYLINIQQNTPSAANIGAYINIVKEKNTLKRMFHVGDQLQHMAMAIDGGTVADKKAKAEQIIDQLFADDSQQGGTSFASAMQMAAMEMEIKENLKDGELLGFGTGLQGLDEKTQGFERGTLSIVGARPSMGKSCFGENLARLAAKNGYGVHFQSYEMKESNIVLRSAAAEMGIHFGHLTNPKDMTAQDRFNYTKFNNMAMGWNWEINRNHLTIDELVSVCRAKKRTGKLDLLVLDHLHLMPLLGDNRNNELALVTSKLKRLAIELDIHVCALAQLNRGVEQRQVKKPVMSDLRDSGGIEQDADFVLLLHRPAYYDDEANPALANIIISKNRNGETGEVDVCWEGIHQRFTNNLPFWQPPIKQQTKRQSMVI